MKYTTELDLETIKRLLNSIDNSLSENIEEKPESILKLINIFNDSIQKSTPKTVLNDIDLLKDFVIDLQSISMKNENVLNDFCFNIEVDYQNWYDLDEDNWEKVEPKEFVQSSSFKTE